LLADQTQALAWFKLSDAPRKGLQATINQLKNAHFELHILSGDHKTNVASVMTAVDAALAMASDTDLSKSSAPALLLRDDLNLIQVLLRKAQQTHTIMQQNLTWALLYNLIALPLAAAGMIPPWGTAIGMSMSSLIVVLNATRLK
jgi:Cu2+-exporting ATPase